jgi:hypothetical protein
LKIIKKEGGHPRYKYQEKGVRDAPLKKLSRKRWGRAPASINSKKEGGQGNPLYINSKKEGGTPPL